MAAEKTHAVVLRVLPFRETSYVVYLFSQRHGLVHGIAKGMRKASKGALFLERGVAVEVMVYVKPHRDLHTLGGVQVLASYPGSRSDLVRTAVRDAGLEMVLATIPAADPHPDLYDALVKFLVEVESVQRRRCFPSLLWEFYVTFASLLGFAPVLDSCVVCHAPVAPDAGGMLVHRDGGIACAGCIRHGAASDALPGWALAGMRGLAQGGSGGINPPSEPEACRVTRALARYCMYHFGIATAPRSLDFLEEIVKGETIG